MLIAARAPLLLHRPKVRDVGYQLKVGQFGSRVRFTHHKHGGIWCVERTLRCPGSSGYPYTLLGILLRTAGYTGVIISGNRLKRHGHQASGEVIPARMANFTRPGRLSMPSLSMIRPR